MAEKPREFCDFKELGQFEAKFYVEVLCFAPLFIDRLHFDFIRLNKTSLVDPVFTHSICSWLFDFSFV